MATGRQIKPCRECGGMPKFKIEINPANNNELKKKIVRRRITCCGKGHKVVYVRPNRKTITSVKKAYVNPIMDELITQWNRRQDGTRNKQRRQSNH